jgi:hypothetical protein
MDDSMSKLPIIAASLVAAVLLAAGCGSTSTHHSAGPKHSAQASAEPVLACKQLLDLPTNGNGISPALSAKLLQETQGTPLGTDMKNYLAAVHAPVPSVGPPGSTREIAAVTAMIEHVSATATAVKNDCQAYGITGLFHGAV